MTLNDNACTNVYKPGNRKHPHSNGFSSMILHENGCFTKLPLKTGFRLPGIYYRMSYSSSFYHHATGWSTPRCNLPSSQGSRYAQSHTTFSQQKRKAAGKELVKSSRWKLDENAIWGVFNDQKHLKMKMHMSWSTKYWWKKHDMWYFDDTIIHQDDNRHHDNIRS